MATKFAITVTGAKQGAFKGGSKRSKWANKSEGFGFEQAVKNPFDANSGQISGKRQYSPIVTSMEVDAATPQYFQALTSNETLTSVKFEFYRPGGTGSEDIAYSVELNNAAVVSFKTFTALDSDKYDSRGGQHDTYEQLEVQFSFQKVTTTWIKGGVTAVDDWLTMT